MRKMYNERHVEIEETASNLDVLRELNKRKALDEALSRELQRLEAKDRGLEMVLMHLNKYSKEHWVYMTNVSLDHYNIFNSDLILMTSTHLYTLEINHYEGLFELKNGNSLLNKERLEQHPILMAQSVTSQIKSMALMESINLKVKGAAIFSNPKNNIRIQEEMDDIEIVSAQQLDHFIKRIVQEEKQHKNITKINPRHTSWLARIDRHYPFWTLEIPGEIKEKAQRGIACSQCENFDIEIGKHYVSCPCGKLESLEESIVRTICDYGVLNNEKDLYPPELHLFFDNQIPIDLIDKYLEKHFTPVG